MIGIVTMKIFLEMRLSETIDSGPESCEDSKQKEVIPFFVVLAMIPLADRLFLLVKSGFLKKRF